MRSQRQILSSHKAAEHQAAIEPRIETKVPSLTRGTMYSEDRKDLRYSSAKRITRSHHHRGHGARYPSRIIRARCEYFTLIYHFSLSFFFVVDRYNSQFLEYLL